MMNRKSILALTCTQYQLSMSLNSQCPLQSHEGHHLLLQSLGSQDAELRTHCLFPLNLFLSLCPSNAILLSLPSYFFNLEPTQHSRFFFLLPLSLVTKSLYNLFSSYVNSTPSSLSGCRPKRWTLPELSFCLTAIALSQPLIQSTMSLTHRGSGVWLCLINHSSSNGSSLLVMSTEW